MGEGVIEATISRWLVPVGAVVERLEPVVEVETDKVTTEVVADAAGKLLKICIEEGETVPVGTVLAEFASDAEPVAQPTPQVTQPAHSTLIEPQETQTNGKNGHAKTAGRPLVAGMRVSPVVARMATEHQLDLTKISGTGKQGRITKRDVVAFMREGESLEKRVESEALPSNQVEVKSEKPAPIVNPKSKIVNLTPMRRAIAQHMVESVQTSPHATTIHEVDFSAVIAHRQALKEPFAEKGVKLTLTAYIMVAVAQALSDNMLVNSSWTDDGIAIHQDINIGMATAVQDGAGLVVPVIKHAADLNLLGMARTVTQLATQARDNKLAAADMQGGTFTVTNHGVSGSLFATPIINQPQAGILGVGALKKQVVVVEDALGNDATAIRPMAYLSCSFDHRILDGVSADRFVAAVVSHLQNWK